MKITANRDVCVGAGNCAFTAPDVFDQDEQDGTVLVLKETPAPDEEQAARDAVAYCPSGALQIED